MKKESTLRTKLKNYIKTEYLATCHVNHGGPLSERGHADLYGVLPTGRAFYIEVKMPDAKKDFVRTQYQRIFMMKEKMNNALVGFATCYEDVDLIFAGEDMLETYES